MTFPITAVLTNWKRPDNVQQIIESLHASGLVCSILVWNNNAELTIDHPYAKVVNANTDFGLYSRFALACLSKTDAVLVQDDDILLPQSTLGALWNHWVKDKEILHGIFGRQPKTDGSYARLVDRTEAEVPIVLTRALIGHRRYFSDFFWVAHFFEHIQNDSDPYGNGEDILLNYTVRKVTGRLNRIHALPTTELPSDHGIHKRIGEMHWRHRTRLMRAAELWLERGNVL